MIFVGGLLVGAVIGAGVLLGVRDPLAQHPAADKQAATAPAVATTQAANCAFAPVLAPAPKGDGLFALPADPRDATAADAAAYVVVGRDAATQGRPRDAEVAFMTSCRMAGPNDAAELAEAKYQLGSHYVTAASIDAAARPEALKRAQALLSDSVALYGARLGLDNGRTRLAAASLASVERALAPPEAPLEVPRVLLAERADYEALRPAPAVSRSLASADKASGEPSEPVTAAMGGPPAIRKAPVRPRVRDTEPDFEETVQRHAGCPDGDCSRPAAATGDAQAAPSGPARRDEGMAGGN